MSWWLVARVRGRHAISNFDERLHQLPGLLAKFGRLLKVREEANVAIELVRILWSHQLLAQTHDVKALHERRREPSAVRWNGIFQIRCEIVFVQERVRAGH